MYKKISEKLTEILLIQLCNSDITKLPNIFWIDGIFGISSSENSNEKIKRYYFAVADNNCKDCKKQLSLTTNNVYFTSGYDQLLSFAPSFADGYKISAKVLLKFIGTTKNSSIAAPLVILKNESVDKE